MREKWRSMPPFQILGIHAVHKEKKMATAGSIAAPTGANLQKSLTNYAVGIAAGVGFNLITRFTGSGILGGALAAGITGAIVPGRPGEIITTSLGFQLGSRGLENLGLGSGLGGLFGGGAQQQKQTGNQFNLA